MDYYEILEVSQNASQEVIKAAYKSLIQRYHPDKNPGNAEIAARASQVVQAYDTLSDPQKRAAYDLQFKQPSSIRTNVASGMPLAGPSARKRTAKTDKSYWYMWFLIVLIIFSGWVILSLMKKQYTPESELNEIRLSIAGQQLSPDVFQEKMKRMEAILSEHPGILKREENARKEEAAARTIPIFIEQLNVNLRVPRQSVSDKDNTLAESGKQLMEPEKASANQSRKPEDLVHVLSIPVMGVKVGSFDSEKVKNHLDSKATFIRQQLAEKLTEASYEELVKIDGEKYLKKMILDSLGEITGTNRFENYPPTRFESPSHYGIVDVFFPEEFAVK